MTDTSDGSQSKLAVLAAAVFLALLCAGSFQGLKSM